MRDLNLKSYKIKSHIKRNCRTISKTYKMKKTLYFTFILLFLTSCKYEEGPAISLRTKKQRLTGTWELAKYQRNFANVDTTSFLLHLDKDDTGIKFGNTQSTPDEPSVSPFKWSFESRKENLVIEEESQNFYRKTEYTIMRLTNNELILSLETATERKRFEFEKF